MEAAKEVDYSVIAFLSPNLPYIGRKLRIVNGNSTVTLSRKIGRQEIERDRCNAQEALLKLYEAR